MSGARLIELGAGPALSNPNGACAGHLLRADASAVLLDCGHGVAGRLRGQMEPAQLDGIVISHLHPDHFIDLIPLRYALTYMQRHPSGRLPLYLPPGGIRHLSRIGTVLAESDRFFLSEFALREYAPGETLAIGEFTIEMLAVQHYILSHAMRVQVDGRTLVYSSDVAPCAAIEAAARDADLFLCEATLLGVDEDNPDPLLRGHLTAAEAGRIARAAGARRLLLTHCANSRREQARRDAEETFGTSVEIAEEGNVYTV